MLSLLICPGLRGEMIPRQFNRLRKNRETCHAEACGSSRHSSLFTQICQKVESKSVRRRVNDQKRSDIKEALASVCGECGSDFLENCPCGCCWVWRRCDWPADHQIIRSCTNGFCRSRDPRLSVFFPFSRASRTSPSLGSDAGDHDQEIFPAGAANGVHLLRGCHNTIQ